MGILQQALTQARRAAAAFGPVSQPVPRATYPPGLGSGNYEPLPPFGTKSPVARPLAKGDTNLDHRLVPPNPFDSWWLTLPAKLTPQYVLNILRAAQGGDLWQQWQLHALMLDQWPMYKKCVHELCEAAASLKYVVRPFAEEGEEPTPEAKRRADFCRRAVLGMRPNPFNDEKDLRATVYHQAQAFPMGMQLSEILWNKPERTKGGWQRTPRATAFVHPRHFTYTSDGYLVVYDEEYNRLYFGADARGQAQPDEDRFLCGQFYTHAGNSLASGHLRALGWWFAALVYNREWSLLFAQKHGTPFMDLTYKPGTPQSELLQMQAFLRNGAADGWVMHVDGSTLQVHSAQGQSRENPTRSLQEEADRQCQLVLLGQTLTTDMPRDGSGSYAASQTHFAVREDRMEALGKWMASVPLQQLVRAVCRVNYAGDDECPVVEADFTKPLSVAEKAQLLTALSGSRIPVAAEPVYAMLGLPVPEEGDLVLVGPQLGELGPTDQEVSAIGDPGVAQIGGQLEQEALARKKGLKRVQAAEVRRALDNATDLELAELRDLVTQAREAEAKGHLNGEGEAVAVRIQQLSGRRFRLED